VHAGDVITDLIRAIGVLSKQIFKKDNGIEVIFMKGYIPLFANLLQFCAGSEFQTVLQ
jgi:hypothetical protein